MNKIIIFTILAISFVFESCNAKNKEKVENSKVESSKMSENIDNNNLEIVTIGGGCFWCVEAQLMELTGVVKVESGYSGGTKENPTYKEVCTGTTGHAEVIQVTYDTTKINFTEIMQAFFSAHDPTTLNRQGNDVGTQYRSVIYYHNDNQKKIALGIISDLEKSGAYKSKIITEVTKFDKFYKAEDYHQNYYNDNKSEGYCQFVIAPKLEKFKKVFHDRLKSN